MDLVERLRSGEDGLEYAAADEIEELLKRIKSLEEEVEGMHGLMAGESL